jgi:hypothetical protein
MGPDSFERDCMEKLYTGAIAEWPLGAYVCTIDDVDGKRYMIVVEEQHIQYFQFPLMISMGKLPKNHYSAAKLTYTLTATPEDVGDENGD